MAEVSRSTQKPEAKRLQTILAAMRAPAELPLPRLTPLADSVHFDVFQRELDRDQIVVLHMTMT